MLQNFALTTFPDENVVENVVDEHGSFNNNNSS